MQEREPSFRVRGGILRNLLDEIVNLEPVRSTDEAVNRVKQVLQEVILCSLSKAGFFREAAFYGGTSLRIIHGLNRFSEDLDFSLLKPNPSFTFSNYFSAIRNEMSAFGIVPEICEKVKNINTSVNTAVLKVNKVELLVSVRFDQKLVRLIPKSEKISVKFEVDIDPPPGFVSEMRIKYLPIFYDLRVFDPPSLFAGKISAILCRRYCNRVKGRDLYDFEWYVRKGIPVNIGHLAQRLKKTDCRPVSDCFGLPDAMEYLRVRFGEIDYDSARADVIPFVEDIHCCDRWCAEYFISLLDALESADYAKAKIRHIENSPVIRNP